MKKILLYGLSDMEADRFQNKAEEMGLAMYVIGDDALEMKINDALAIEDDLDGRHEEFEDEYMLFHEFELKDIISTLKAFEKAGLAFSGVNVMRTDLNESWTLRKLMKAAAKEHHISKKAIQLQAVLRACNGTDTSDMEESQRREFKASIKKGLELLNSRKLLDGEADEVMEDLRFYLQKTKRLLN